jgi:eukaryotic-like serine/threonine-protein kinase
MSERDRRSDEPIDPPSEGALRAVAGFRLLRKIGEGGMSAVFQSYDVTGDRPVAVKILAEHLAGQPEFVGRFYREARLSRVLEHAQIVQGYASGFDPETDKHYLVLELIDGPSAHGALARLGRLPVGMVVRIGIDIARALDFLHDRQYVHRDVKPDNVLLHPDGGAKLADLGLAKRLNDDSQLTAIHQGVGTSYYMAYEQAVNANLVDGRSDIFALGATLYHLLTGEVPFPGATHDEVVREKWEGSFRPIRDTNSAVPTAVASLIESTLACDPRARVQRAGQLAKALSATKLATRLPSFAHGSSPPCGNEPSDDDSPTRTDHLPPAPSPPVCGRSYPPVPPLPPPCGEMFTSAGTMPAVGSTGPVGTPGPPPVAPPPPNAERRGWPWFVGTGVILLALLAHEFYSSRPPTAPKLPARSHVGRDSPGAPSGLHPIAAQ